MNKKLLGICLFYNDDDIAYYNIKQLLESNHDVIVFNHGSTDKTSDVIDTLKSELIEVVNIDRDKVGFYQVFKYVSQYIINNYCKKYDWISFPESDEFLEGPDRQKTYYEYLLEVIDSEHNYIEFDNFNFWFTEKDDTTIKSPIERVKYYSFRVCAPRVYSFRSSSMNIREFNHNPTKGTKYPIDFRTRHYQIRSLEHMEKRLFSSRYGIENKKTSNAHNKTMIANYNNMLISSDKLNYDDGIRELVKKEIIKWNILYGC